jgi:hypothetical protein
MSTDRDDDIPGLREVGAAYAHVCRSEQPPGDIDRAIRRAAADQASRRAARQSRLRAWTVAAALAATVVLGVTGLLRTDGGSNVPAHGTPSDVEAAAATAERNGGAESSAPDALQEPPARASGKITFDAGDPATGGPTDAAANGDCGSTSVAPAAWLACIATLERAGRARDAARELDAFRAQFPDYALPAELDSSQQR